MSLSRSVSSNTRGGASNRQASPIQVYRLGPAPQEESTKSVTFTARTKAASRGIIYEDDDSERSPRVNIKGTLRTKMTKQSPQTRLQPYVKPNDSKKTLVNNQSTSKEALG